MITSMFFCDSSLDFTITSITIITITTNRKLRSRLGLDKLYDNNSIMEIMRISIAIGKLQ